MKTDTVKQEYVVFYETGDDRKGSVIFTGEIKNKEDYLNLLDSLKKEIKKEIKTDVVITGIVRLPL